MSVKLFKLYRLPKNVYLSLSYCGEKFQVRTFGVYWPKRNGSYVHNLFTHARGATDS